MCALVAMLVAGPVPPARADTAAEREFHDVACAVWPVSSSPWHVTNLYDCAARALYIPYQLWTGAPWDGGKGGTCMHEANSRFEVNGTSRTRIKGPVIWSNPRTGARETVWERKKEDGSKTQYFTCHENGIGRVYDNRGPRYYDSGRCKFPAGYGWEIGTRRSCRSTSIEITRIGLDDTGYLEELIFKWWTRSSLDQIYRYVPDYGMTHAWPQR